MGTFIINLIHLDLIIKVQFAIYIRYFEFWNFFQSSYLLDTPLPPHYERIHSFDLLNKQVPGN